MSNTILMCRPDFFDVSYDINVWMGGNKNSVKNKLAQEQWAALYTALSKVADIKLIDPVQGLPDMVFTANAGLHVKGKIFLSKFKHAERQPEELHFRQWFLDQGYHVIEQSRVSFEGQGDCLVDATNTHWMGHRFRSDPEYANSLWKFGVNVRSVKLVDDRFYHIDTCFCPLPDGTLIYYPGAFDAESRLAIEEHFSNLSRHEIIRVTEAEAVTFCCNTVVIGLDIFMPTCNTLANRLETRGYRVHEFDMSEFQKSGGACKCLIMHL